MTTLIQKRTSEQGFTLVELAIVMIIIGLLIGGVLKGQELINNAQITSAVAQLRNVDIALSGFRDAYNAIPGDMTSAQARLPGCIAAPCNVDGDGNGRLDTAPGVAVDNGDETFAVWSQLAAGNFIQGVNITTATPTLLRADTAPATEIGDNSLITIGFHANLAALASANQVAPQGMYMVITAADDGDVANAVGGVSMTPNAAQRVDSKLDDGAPNAGTVRAAGTAGANATDCTDGGNADDIYKEALEANNCALYIQVQG